MNVNAYIARIEHCFALGHATEHTYRSALKELIEEGGRNIGAINEPKRSAVGAPDFRVVRRAVPLGYIETKDVGTSLTAESKSDQLTRYREGLSNLILTDYLEFRWFVDGNLRSTVRLGRRTGNVIRQTRTGAQELRELLQAFLEVRTGLIRNSEQLAKLLATSARLIRAQIATVLSDEGQRGPLRRQLEGFRRVLIADLDEDKFADMYAQTISYGLFAARIEHRSSLPFTRQNAAWEMPAANPFLRDIFNHIAGPALDQKVSWAVDDLADLLGRADILRVMRNFGVQGGRSDPVFHFYETFLQAYDPAERERLGVYFTPIPVVEFMVRAVDQILRDDFALADGIGNTSKIRNPDGEEVHRLQILDPAVGTGTFLHVVIAHLRARFDELEGLWPPYVREHLIPRLFGFELLMAPYTIAHMKLGLQLQQSGYTMAEGERLNVYLTNTLEAEFELRGLPLFASWIAEEADAAANIKLDAPVMVILGNPPYSGTSTNKGDWIVRLLKGYDTITSTVTNDYFTADGASLNERQLRWLHDDYVKFIRFAQWRIERTGHGVLAFITNHRYLENPTFRGMRQALLQTFDKVYIFDLHGNSKSRERAPNGGMNENVFDIQQGVAIMLLIKRERFVGKPEVWRADLWGPRNTINLPGEVHIGKYDFLQGSSIQDVQWKRAYPTAPGYYFDPVEESDVSSSPRKRRLSKRKEQPPEGTAGGLGYSHFVSVTAIFPFHSSGFIAGFKEIGTSIDAEALIQRVETLRAASDIVSDADAASDLGFDDAFEQFIALRQRVKSLSSWRQRITNYLHRPFDVRKVLFDRAVLIRPVLPVQKHLMGHQNKALLVSRQTTEFHNVFVTDKPVAFNALGSAGSYGSGYVFPLYLYPDAGQLSFEAPQRAINISDAYVERLASIGVRVRDNAGPEYSAPEDVLGYVYAWLHAAPYREAFALHLKREFPSIPFPESAELFREMARLGTALIKCHLPPRGASTRTTTFPVAGLNNVAVVRWEPLKTTGRLWINDTQYFGSINPDAWVTRIGNWVVGEKWLADRVGQTLSAEELRGFIDMMDSLSDAVPLINDISDLAARALTR